jgi:thiamine-phosphate pyrophosphorylase
MRIPGFLLPPRARCSGLPRFLALTDASRAPDPFTLLAHLPKDAGLVWRAYGEHISRPRLQALSRAARQAHTLLFLASAQARRAPPPSLHQHWPEHRLNRPYTDGKPRPQHRALITAAAHSERAIIAAARARVDAVLISPVFATRSHPGSASLGVTRFAALARLAHARGLAVYALGGINDPAKIRRVKPCGISGIAGIELFVSKHQA